MWIARWRKKRDTCTECGNPIEECSDPKRAWYPYRTICYATMARAAAQAMFDALHEAAPYHDGTFTRWSKKRTPQFPFGHTQGDGVTIGVAAEDFASWDKFTTETNASPLPPESD